MCSDSCIWRRPQEGPYVGIPAFGRAASGLGGYEESVKTTATIDQDHPKNTDSVKARAEGVEQDRPNETKPGQPESGVGKTIDEMI